MLNRHAVETTGKSLHSQHPGSSHAVNAIHASDVVPEAVPSPPDSLLAKTCQLRPSSRSASGHKSGPHSPLCGVPQHAPTPHVPEASQPMRTISQKAHHTPATRRTEDCADHFTATRASDAVREAAPSPTDSLIAKTCRRRPSFESGLAAKSLFSNSAPSSNSSPATASKATPPTTAPPPPSATVSSLSAPRRRCAAIGE
jgi:hypothetical protein